MAVGKSRAFWLATPALAALLSTAASWWMRLATGTMKVDGSRPGAAISLLAIVLVSAALALMFGFYRRTELAVPSPPLTPSEVRRSAQLACLAAAPMLPLLTNDLFSVLAYGDLFVRGLDPYADPVPLAYSHLYPYVAPIWQAAPCPYGPVTVALAAAAVWMAGGGVLAAMAFYKLLALVACLVVIELAHRYTVEHPEHADARTLALVILSPIFWLQGAGQVHNDVFSVLFLLAGMLALGRRHYLLAAAAVTLALLNKFSALIGVGLFLVWLLNAEGGNWRRLTRTLAGATAVAAGCALVLYAPLWRGWPTLLVPLDFLTEKPLANSLAQVLVTVLARVGRWLSPVAAAEGDVALRPAVELLLLSGGLVLAAFQLAPLLRPSSGRPRPPGEVLHRFARAGVLLLTVAYSVFYPWYLMTVLPLFLARSPAVWTRWLVLVAVVSPLMDVSQMTDFHSLAYWVFHPLFAYGTLALFLLDLRRRFVGARPRAERPARVAVHGRSPSLPEPSSVEAETP